jgi:outer membrane lipoprotein SlyB
MITLKRFLAGLVMMLFMLTDIPLGAVVRCHINRYGHRVCVKTRSKKKQVAIVGGSALGGAAVGALAGGGKGAGIGAIVGGVGGAIYNQHTKKKVYRDQ